MLGMILLISDFNPPEAWVEKLRVVNAIVALIACFIIWYFLARPRWHIWCVSERLSWMSFFMLCFTGFYGSIEVTYFDTFFRVPMVTLSLLWAIIAALWPSSRETPGSGKR